MIHETTVEGLRVLEMDDGKVNFLSLPMREALLDAFVRADADAKVPAVILIGRGACFCAGMNIDDFEAGTALMAPSLHNEILDILATMSKPVFAAIHGGAHGGGLELALGCHYRVALKGAKVSLPEVLVGMMPGARGTQHLPRAIGLEAAADMILNGRRVVAEQAPSGLIDLVVEADLISKTVGFAKSIADERPIPNLRDNIVAAGEIDLSNFAPMGASDYPGITPVIAALNASVNIPFEKAIAQEFSAFSALAKTEASKKIRAAFLAKLKTDSDARRQKNL